MATALKTASFLLYLGLSPAWAQSVGIQDDQQPVQIGNSVLIDIGEATGGALPKNSFIELKIPNQNNTQALPQNELKLQTFVSKQNGAEYLQAIVGGQAVPTEKLAIKVKDEYQRETWGLSVDPMTGKLRKARPGNYSIEVQFRNKVEKIPYQVRDQKKE